MRAPLRQAELSAEARRIQKALQAEGELFRQHLERGLLEREGAGHG